MKIRPDLGNNQCCYEDDNHWVVKVTDDAGFQGWAKGEYDYVIWSLEEGCEIAIINVASNGELVCESTAGQTDAGTEIVSTFVEAIAWAEEMLDLMSDT
jgi:hypothetical protein